MGSGSKYVCWSIVPQRAGTREVAIVGGGAGATGVLSAVDIYTVADMQQAKRTWLAQASKIASIRSSNVVASMVYKERNRRRYVKFGSKHPYRLR